MADLDKAMQHYEQAADYFKGEESNSSANKCMLKVRTGATGLYRATRLGPHCGRHRAGASGGYRATIPYYAQIDRR